MNGISGKVPPTLMPQLRPDPAKPGEVPSALPRRTTQPSGRAQSAPGKRSAEQITPDSPRVPTPKPMNALNTLLQQLQKSKPGPDTPLHPGADQTVVFGTWLKGQQTGSDFLNAGLRQAAKLCADHAITSEQFGGVVRALATAVDGGQMKPATARAFVDALDTLPGRHTSPAIMRAAAQALGHATGQFEHSYGITRNHAADALLDMLAKRGEPQAAGVFQSFVSALEKAAGFAAAPAQQVLEPEPAAKGGPPALSPQIQELALPNDPAPPLPDIPDEPDPYLGPFRSQLDLALDAVRLQLNSASAGAEPPRSALAPSMKVIANTVNAQSEDGAKTTLEAITAALFPSERTERMDPLQDARELRSFASVAELSSGLGDSQRQLLKDTIERSALEPRLKDAMAHVVVNFKTDVEIDRIVGDAISAPRKTAFFRQPVPDVLSGPTAKSEAIALVHLGGDPALIAKSVLGSLGRNPADEAASLLQGVAMTTRDEAEMSALEGFAKALGSTLKAAGQYREVKGNEGDPRVVRLLSAFHIAATTARLQPDGKHRLPADHPEQLLRARIDQGVLQLMREGEDSNAIARAMIATRFIQGSLPTITAALTYLQDTATRLLASDLPKFTEFAKALGAALENEGLYLEEHVKPTKEFQTNPLLKAVITALRGGASTARLNRAERGQTTETTMLQQAGRGDFTACFKLISDLLEAGGEDAVRSLGQIMLNAPSSRDLRANGQPPSVEPFARLQEFYIWIQQEKTSAEKTLAEKTLAVKNLAEKTSAQPTLAEKTSTKKALADETLAKESLGHIRQLEIIQVAMQQRHDQAQASASGFSL